MALRMGMEPGGAVADLVGSDDGDNAFVYGVLGCRRASTMEVLSEFDAANQCMVLGTMAAPDAVLQRRGTRVLYVITARSEDVPFMGRLDNEDRYNLSWTIPDPIVRRRD